MSTILGACLLSAAATLPLHLLPMLVVAVLQEGRLTPLQAGWVGSCYMVGQLIMVLLLPTLGFQRVARLAALLAAVVLVSAVIVSNSQWQAVLLVAWLLTGLACGSLQFLATTTAATAADKRFAFALRMAMSSALGGAVIVALQLAQGFAGYSALTLQLAIAFSVAAGLGLILYRMPPRVSSVTPRKGAAARSLDVAMLAGLVVLFLLFVGQHGLIAFAVQGAHQRGLALDQLVWAIVFCKFAGALIVFVSGLGGTPKIGPPIPLSALAVAAGGFCLAGAIKVEVFWLGLFLWEVGLNVLSARLQTAVALLNPRRAGMWMTSVIFLGAAGGPVLAGWATNGGLFHVFAAFSVATALFPWVWIRCSRKSGTEIRQG